jgi:choline dehydrogenase-like flavoprotein
VPFEEDTTALLDAAYEYRYKKNLNGNDEDPTGISVEAAASYGRIRTISASAHVVSGTPNMTIMVVSRATKILFDGTKATAGVRINGTKTVYASKEVILRADAIDSPKLLLLSDVSPANELQVGIIIVHDLPSVGKNLQDHCDVFTSELVDNSICSRSSSINSEEQIQKAQKQWNEDRSGSLTVHYGTVCRAFLQEPSLVRIKYWR